MGFDCPLCNHVFSGRSALENHLNRLNCCVSSPLTEEQQERLDEVIVTYDIKIIKPLLCDGCDFRTNRAYNLKRHKESGTCSNFKNSANIKKKNDNQVAKVNDLNKLMDIVSSLSQRMEATESRIGATESRIEATENRPNHVHNNNTGNSFNVMCIDSTDNLLQMLTTRMGRRGAIELTKQSALTMSVESDSRLLDHAYMTDEDNNEITTPPATFTSSKETEVEYESRIHGHKTENIVTFADMLSSLIKNCYSEALSIIIDDRDHKQSKTYGGLDDYEIGLWAQHQAKLTDNKYKKNILKHTALIAKKPKRSI